MEKKYEDLVNIILEYQVAYYKGKPMVTDVEFDALYDQLLEIESKHPELISDISPSKRVGSDLNNDFEVVEHSIPVLSLDKAYTDEAVLQWMHKSQVKIDQELSFVLEEKIDGISIVLYYIDGIFSKAVTRGNGQVGNDVSNNVKTITSIPLKLNKNLTGAVRGEIFISKADFAALEESEYKNPRNLAAGTIRRLQSSQVSNMPLDIFVYEAFWQNKDNKDHVEIISELKELGFKTNPHLALFCSTKEKAEQRIKEANIEAETYAFENIDQYLINKTEKRQSLEYEIDGIVAKVNEIETRELFGYTEHHPRWAIAYKFESPQASSKVLDITIQVGRTGRITPVAELEKVAIGGSEIRRASLHNQEYINELELAIGDVVSVVKRGDVIPQVQDVVEKGEGVAFIIPDVCPACNSKLIKHGAHLFCDNYYCEEQILQRIEYFTSRDQMDMRGLGPSSIKILYEQGLIKDITDLYTCDFNSLMGVKNVGLKTIIGFKESIIESKKQPYYTVLASLGLPEIGKKSAKILIDGGFDDIDKLLEAAKSRDLDRFTNIDQIGLQTATLLIKALEDEKTLELISKLREAGLQFSKVESVNNEEQIFENQIWCATGSLSSFSQRSLALAEVEKRGGKTTNTISGKTTHLLLGEGGGSKRSKAEALGVKIVSEEEFLSLIKVKEKRVKKEVQTSLFD